MRGRIITWIFTLYVVLIVVLTLAPPPISPSNGLLGTNLIPFVGSIKCFVPDPGQPSTTEFCWRIIAGNFVMFVPLGIMLPLVFEQMASAKPVLIAALTVSISVEVLQYAGRWIGSARWSDIDDVLLNVAGAFIGYALLRLAQFSGRLLVTPDT